MQSPLNNHGPLVGIDIGSHTAKLAQVRRGGHGAEVVAYGHVAFAPESIVEGVVVDPDKLAQTIQPLLAGQTTGVKFSARHVATALPVAKVFTRTLQLPPMEPSDLEEAIKLEAEQSIPIPATDLYMDHEIIDTIKTAKGDSQIEVLLVAAPRAIVDSYVKLFKLLGLGIAAIEVSLMSIARALADSKETHGPTLILDIGSSSADVAVCDRVIRFTGTMAGGGDQITAALVKSLGITTEQANEIKYKFGIGPSGLQEKAQAALTPILQTLISETTKAMKYYTDRNPNHQITNLVLTGGGANMPGLIEYLSASLKNLKVSVANPWQTLTVGHIKTPGQTEASLYTAALGLALVGVEA